MKKVFGFIISIVLFVAVIMAMQIGGGYFGLKYKEFFSPKFQNVERKVFEETQSYSHGKTQDLAKYFEEYSNSSGDSKESIRQLILLNFADFEADKIRSHKLRNFLTQQRGY